MVPTPEQVVPLLLPALADLREALQAGIDHADDLQPEQASRDPWYWSHSARWKACGTLRSATSDGWTLLPEVPNCGIHLRLDDLHVVRVLRSLGGTTPHPGSNRRRAQAWTGVQVLQGQFLLASAGSLPPLSLVVDWQEVDGEPELHVGLPAGPWRYGSVPRLYWRVPLPQAGIDLDTLVFDPGPDTGEPLVTLRVDPAEEEQA